MDEVKSVTFGFSSLSDPDFSWKTDRPFMAFVDDLSSVERMMEDMIWIKESQLNKKRPYDLHKWCRLDQYDVTRHSWRAMSERGVEKLFKDLRDETSKETASLMAAEGECKESV